jgi:antitoxin HicB
MEYPIILDRSEGGAVIVTFPDFPEARAEGEYKEDALIRAKEVLAKALGACIKSRNPIPPPSRGEHTYVIHPPALVDAKVQVYQAMRTAGVGGAELARRLHWHRPQVDRLLNVSHGSRLGQLEAALSVLGKRMSISLVDETEDA